MRPVQHTDRIQCKKSQQRLRQSDDRYQCGHSPELSQEGSLSNRVLTSCMNVDSRVACFIFMADTRSAGDAPLVSEHVQSVPEHVSLAPETSQVKAAPPAGESSKAPELPSRPAKLIRKRRRRDDASSDDEADQSAAAAKAAELREEQRVGKHGRFASNPTRPRSASLRSFERDPTVLMWRCSINLAPRPLQPRPRRLFRRLQTRLRANQSWAVALPDRSAATCASKTRLCRLVSSRWCRDHTTTHRFLLTRSGIRDPTDG